MVEIVDIYIFVLVATALLSLGVVFVAWTQRAAKGALAIVVMMLGVSFWCASEAMFWLSASHDSQVVWLRLSYLGPSVTIAGLLVFALGVAKVEAHCNPRACLLISAPLAVTCIAAMTNPGGLIISGYAPRLIGPHTFYLPQNGPLFWLYILVTYGMYLLGFFLIARSGVRFRSAGSAQPWIMAAATSVPFGVSVWNQLQRFPVEGLEAAAFFVTGVVLLAALVRGRLLDSSGHVVTAQDALEAKKRERELLSVNRALEDRLGTVGLYRTLTEMIPDFVFVIDGDMRVVLANSAAARFTGRPQELLVGARVGELFGPMGARFEAHLSEAASGHPLEYESALPDGGSELWLRTTLVSLADVEPGFVLGVSRDITDSKRIESTLRRRAEHEERLATHDTLTGIENRRAFMTALERALALARRGRLSTVLFMDIDNFKLCNDQRGHAFGDEVLVSVADVLKSQVREVDLVARFGGDEFAALLAGSTEADSLVVAKRMKAGVESLGEGYGIPISIAIGIVGVDAEASLDGIIATADQSMYEYKMAHRRAREASE